MGIAELLVLLSLGLFMGILSTVFDILVVGAASFLSHVALWVLLNALLAALLESRIQACLWSIPFNLGWVEAYFITTSASYEGFARSLVVPLVAVAFLSPFLVYALWTAKSEKNAFGYGLSALLVAGTLAASYLINDRFTIFNVVVSLLVGVVLLWLPVRRFKVTRKPLAAAAALAEMPRKGIDRAMSRVRRRKEHDEGEDTGRGRKKRARRTEESPEAQADAVDEPAPDDVQAQKSPATPKRKARKTRPSEAHDAERAKSAPRRKPQKERAAEQTEAKQPKATSKRRARKARPAEPASGEPRPSATKKLRRPTKRTGGESTTATKRKTSRERRAEKELEAQQREERRRAAARRRAQDLEASGTDDVHEEYDGYVSRLGTSRSARPSNRSSR